MHSIVTYILAVVYCCSLSVSSVEISPCARWNRHGVTVAGNGISGDEPTQLSIPNGIFVMKRTNTLYVADTGNKRVQMFSLNPSSSSGTTVIFDVNHPTKIYVDDDEDGPTIYIAVSIGNRVEKWTKGAAEGIQLGGECRSCAGVALDNEKNVYMTESDRFRVAKWSVQTHVTTTAAGQTDVRGTTEEYLSRPEGIYFDRSSDALYVADSWNNRIQKWEKGASSGILVAGSNASTPGGDNSSLDEPNGVWVDEKTKVIYVADTLNNRIMRWLPHVSEGHIIAGGRDSGNATDQFNTPSDLAFDSEGNLYVCDTWNHRIQMFSIIDNKPCHPISAATKSQVFYYKWIVITTILPILTWFIGEVF